MDEFCIGIKVYSFEVIVVKVMDDIVVYFFIGYQNGSFGFVFKEVGFEESCVWVLVFFLDDDVEVFIVRRDVKYVNMFFFKMR